MSRKFSIEEVKARLYAVHGDVVSLKESTYVDNNTNCIFVDKTYGEWLGDPRHIINRGSSHSKRKYEKQTQTSLNRYGVTHWTSLQSVKDKQKRTFLKKYGVDSASKNPEVAKKQALSVNNSCVLIHWKTGEKVVCVASYEKKVIEYLNKNQIDFDFQIPFDMPDGKRYFIDLYLKEQSVWVEIKGYKRLKGMKKWEWFHSEHSNSELWDKQKLKEMKIL